jgi:hypothetical protein
MRRKKRVPKVFVVQHVRELPDEVEEVKFIGVYSTPGAARDAIRELLVQPGFATFPDGFCVSRYVIDETHWREGFIAPTDDLLA